MRTVGGRAGQEQVGRHHPQLIRQGEVVVQARYGPARPPFDVGGQVGQALHQRVHARRPGSSRAPAGRVQRSGFQWAIWLHQTVGGRPEPDGRRSITGRDRRQSSPRR